MTEGSIAKKMTLFALPVFLGQLLQQLYNIVDSIVVGNFSGKEALAAVSSSGSLIFLLVGFINGLFTGAGVIIGNRYGARDDDSVHTAVHTAVAFGYLSGIGLTIFGILISPFILNLMGTPLDVLPESVLYFRIYFCGALFNVMYNTCCGIFQAMGDSKHPLYYLITSALCNIALDLIFVGLFHMGVSGAALATVISQAISALLAFIKLTHVDGVHRVVIKDIRLDGPTLKQELSLGIPTGIQNSVIAIANVVVQSNINAFGSYAMAGCGSYFKVEGFAFLPINSFCVALTTFTSQNLGAGQYDRARKGARFGIGMGTLLSEITGALFFVFAPVILRMFSQDPMVNSYGIMQAHTETLFYFLLAYSHCMAATLRGSGRTKVPMYVMLISWCLIRITYITIAVRFFPFIRTVFIAYPITWSLSTFLFTVYYIKSKIFDRQDV